MDTPGLDLQALAATYPDCPDPASVQMFLAAIEERIVRGMAPVLAELNRLYNRVRRLDGDDGSIVPYNVVYFPDGSDPTEAPHNLRLLGSVNTLKTLGSKHLIAYLKGYNITPLPVGGNTRATNRLQKEALGKAVGVLINWD